VYKIPARTLFMGQNLIYVPECHSTNTLLADLAGKQALPEGTVVITGFQSAGRGQRGNTWVVEPNLNITASVLVHPHFLGAHEQFCLTEWVVLAIVAALRNFVNGPVQIKWPNDVLISQRKVCGVLIENSLSGGSIGQTIVGIGLNVNQQQFEFEGATSLRLEGQRDFSLPEVFETLCECLERGYLELRSGKSLREKYLEQLYGLGKSLALRDADGDFVGILEGISAEGKLLVNREGNTKAYGLKEIQFQSAYQPR
jgi:BirA family biotin operon repressor/biotin-[acetyl-CoA-carboxylase] ligase